MTYIVSMRNF